MAIHPRIEIQGILATKSMNNQKGFTIVEAIIILCILTLLALVSVPKFLETKKSVQQAHCQANIQNIALAVIQYASIYSVDIDSKLHLYNDKIMPSSPEESNHTCLIPEYIVCPEIHLPYRDPGRIYPISIVCPIEDESKNHGTFLNIKLKF